MAVTSGLKLDPYEILSPQGTGGMRPVASVLLLGLVMFAQQPAKAPAAKSQRVPEQNSSASASAPQSTSPSAPQAPAPASGRSTQAPPQEPVLQPATPPVLKITTRLVLIDVVVTDTSGKPVTDLKQSDFEIRENGKPQRIAAFAFQAPPSMETGYRPFVPPPGVYTNLRNINGHVGPPTILLIDALNTPFKDQLYMRQQFVRYLEHLQPGRNLAIYTLGTRLRMVQDFTSDPDLLREALKRVMPQSSMFNQAKAVEDEFPGLDPDSSDQHISHIAQNIQEFEVEKNAFLLGMRVRITMDAMKELAHKVAGYPGRKNLVWLSGSFPFATFPEGSRNPTNIQRQYVYVDDLRRTAAIFSNEQVAVYPVDARGLVAGFFPDASERGSSLADRNGGMNATQMVERGSAELLATHDTMKELARETGGRAFYNRNDIDRAIALSVAEGSTYYTLAYSPEDKTADGKFRKIEVKLDRKRLEAHYRKGYFAVDVGPRDERAARNEFVRALASDAPVTTAVPFLVRVSPPDKEHKDMALDFSVVPTTISFELQGELEHAEVEFLTRIYDMKGRPVGSTVAALLSTHLKPETYQQVMTHGLRYTQTITLAPGTYLLKMGVRDRRSNAIGTLAAKVNIPQA